MLFTKYLSIFFCWQKPISIWIRKYLLTKINLCFKKKNSQIYLEKQYNLFLKKSYPRFRLNFFFKLIIKKIREKKFKFILKNVISNSKKKKDLFKNNNLLKEKLNLLKREIQFY